MPGRAPKPPLSPDRKPSPRFRSHQPTLDTPLRPRTLAHLTRTHLSDADIESFSREIRSNSDRITCIVLSALLERDLEKAIITRLSINIIDKQLLYNLFF